ncbi:condensation domain-containing protein [Micromonospora haikouensis]|uniref:condensation domain-containing protein n=1 Tax=Micromonospora haikouensis TaxID=686309 RepID=UPI00069848FA|nr:condensation domain-containing protein [Micromonospora haikouensis]
MGTLMGRLAAMSEEDRARVLAKVRGAAGGPAGTGEPRLAPGACPAGRGPASFVQEQLWFVSQLAQGVPAYNVSFAFHLTGPLDADALLAAVRDVVRRHDVLRSRLVLADGRLVQEVTDADPRVPVRDLTGAPDPQRAAQERVAALSRTAFDLAARPPLRLELLRISPTRHALAWIAHHTLVDGWSFGILLTELAGAYRARCAGREPDLPEVRLQFRDVAHWQRERMTGPTLDRLLDRWQRRLAGPAPAELPTDRPRGAAQTFRGGMLRFDFGADAAAGVAAVADRLRVTPFAVLLGAYALVVAAYAGSDAAVVGAPLAGRGRPELDAVVGPFSNTLPLRVDLSGDPTGAEVLTRANDAMLDAVSGQDVPFSRLADAVRGDRDARRNPLFDVLFNLGNLPPGSDRADLGGQTRLEVRGCPNGTVRLDLELTAEHTPQALTGRLEYNADLFDEATAGALLDDVRLVVGQLAADPTTRRSALEVPGARRRRLAAAARAAGGDAAPLRPARTAARRTRAWSR